MFRNKFVLQVSERETPVDDNTKSSLFSISNHIDDHISIIRRSLKKLEPIFLNSDACFIEDDVMELINNSISVLRTILLSPSILFSTNVFNEPKIESMDSFPKLFNDFMQIASDLFSKVYFPKQTYSPFLLSFSSLHLFYYRMVAYPNENFEKGKFISIWCRFFERLRYNPINTVAIEEFLKSDIRIEPEDYDNLSNLVRNISNSKLNAKHLESVIEAINKISLKNPNNGLNGLLLLVRLGLSFLYLYELSSRIDSFIHTPSFVLNPIMFKDEGLFKNVTIQCLRVFIAERFYFWEVNEKDDISLYNTIIEKLTKWEFKNLKELKLGNNNVKFDDSLYTIIEKTWPSRPPPINQLMNSIRDSKDDPEKAIESYFFYSRVNEETKKIIEANYKSSYHFSVEEYFFYRIFDLKLKSYDALVEKLVMDTNRNSKYDVPNSDLISIIETINLLHSKLSMKGLFVQNFDIINVIGVLFEYSSFFAISDPKLVESQISAFPFPTIESIKNSLKYYPKETGKFSFLNNCIKESYKLSSIAQSLFSENGPKIGSHYNQIETFRDQLSSYCDMLEDMVLINKYLLLYNEISNKDKEITTNAKTENDYVYYLKSLIRILKSDFFVKIARNKFNESVYSLLKSLLHDGDSGDRFKNMVELIPHLDFSQKIKMFFVNLQVLFSKFSVWETQSNDPKYKSCIDFIEQAKLLFLRMLIYENVKKSEFFDLSKKMTKDLYQISSSSFEEVYPLWKYVDELFINIILLKKLKKMPYKLDIPNKSLKEFFLINFLSSISLSLDLLYDRPIMSNSFNTTKMVFTSYIRIFMIDRLGLFEVNSHLSPHHIPPHPSQWKSIIESYFELRKEIPFSQIHTFVSRIPPILVNLSYILSESSTLDASHLHYIKKLNEIVTMVNNSTILSEQIIQVSRFSVIAIEFKNHLLLNGSEVVSIIDELQNISEECLSIVSQHVFFLIGDILLSTIEIDGVDFSPIKYYCPCEMYVRLSHHELYSSPPTFFDKVSLVFENIASIQSMISVKEEDEYKENGYDTIANQIKRIDDHIRKSLYESELHGYINEHLSVHLIDKKRLQEEIGILIEKLNMKVSSNTSKFTEEEAIYKNLVITLKNKKKKINNLEKELKKIDSNHSRVSMDISEIQRQLDFYETTNRGVSNSCNLSKNPAPNVKLASEKQYSINTDSTFIHISNKISQLMEENRNLRQTYHDTITNSVNFVPKISSLKQDIESLEKKKLSLTEQMDNTIRYLKEPFDNGLELIDEKIFSSFDPIRKQIAMSTEITPELVEIFENAAFNVFRAINIHHEHLEIARRLLIETKRKKSIL